MDIRGITVILHKKAKTGEDSFGAPVYEDTTVEVENVLVSPTSTEDAATIQNLTGKHAAYTLAIPKGDENGWEDTEIEFFGKKWRTFGFTIQGIEELIPLMWNKKVMVEAYE